MSHGYPKSYLHNISGGCGSTNEKYRRKYKRIKELIKDFVIKNAALCDEVSQTQEKILIIKNQRRSLLKKLKRLEAAAPPNFNELEHKASTSVASCVMPARQPMKSNGNSDVAAMQMLPVGSDNAAELASLGYAKAETQSRTVHIAAAVGSALDEDMRTFMWGTDKE